MFNSGAADVVLSNLLFSLSQVVIHSCLPQVIVLLVCQELGLSGSDCDGSYTSAMAASVTLHCSLIITIPGLLVIAFYGSFADRYGLKKTLMMPVLGNFMFCGCILLSLSGVMSAFYLHILLFGALCSGLSGSRNTFIMASFTYAAESSSASERSDVFSFIESAIYFAKIVGPLVVGEISKHYGFSFSLALGMFLCVLNSVWITFFLKEPIVQDGEREGEKAGYIELADETRPRPALSFHPLETLKKIQKLFGKECLGNSSVPYVSFAFFLYYMSTLGEVSIEILFQKRTFHFSPVMIGCFGSLGGLMQCLSMIAMPSVFFFIFKIQLEDIYWIEIGLWWKVVYYACFGLAAQARQLFFILPILLFCGPIVPRTRSYLSKAVKNSQQTELFVAIAALEAVGAALGPSLTLGYTHSVSDFPGLMFEVTALICALAASIIFYVRIRMLGGTLLYQSIMGSRDCEIN